jgi:hypothetical protein
MRIKIGKYTISFYSRDYSRDQIWIENELEEGMAIPEKDLEKCLDEFWEKIF